MSSSSKHARDVALQILDPALLTTAEAVEQRAIELARARQQFADAEDQYRQAWEAAVHSGWRPTQLDQLPHVEARPKKKRGGRAGRGTAAGAPGWSPGPREELP